MKKFILGLIFGGICTVVFLVAAQAQTSELSFVTSHGAKTAKTCKGKLKGRYRLVFASGYRCTLEVKRNGDVRPQSDEIRQCSGGNSIVGGKLALNPPLVNKHTRTNQCFVTGIIVLDQGEIEIYEAFIELSGDGFGGIGENPDDFGQQSLSARKY